MHRLRRVCAAGLSAALLSAALSGCSGGKTPAPVTTLTVWHYYNSTQQEIFNQMVEEFNSTLGAQEGITVLTYNQGGINDVAEKALAALGDPAAAETIPDLFAAYSDVASEADELGMVADLTPYFTAEELEAYLPDYLEEGTFDGKLKLFPIAKCSELLFLNETEWQAFSAATGAEKSALTTWEGLAQTAEAYYQWTDGLTPDLPDDGKAFFGRDAFANYMLVGSAQLGVPLFDAGREDAVLADRDVMRRLWENYFVPYVSGCYTDYGRFRSDDLRTGYLACYVGSSSGASHFPEEITLDDGTTTPIEGWVSVPPSFDGTVPMAVQQGAGMVVSASTPEREQAAATFLKWFTAPERNALFAVSTSYSPVTYEANTPEALDRSVGASENPVAPLVRESLALASQLTQTHGMYAPAPFPGELKVRNLVNAHLSDAAKAGREAVLTLMGQGLSRDEAVAQVAGQEAFDAWYTDFQSALDAVKP